MSATGLSRHPIDANECLLSGVKRSRRAECPLWLLAEFDGKLARIMLTGAYALGPEAGEWLQQATLELLRRRPGAFARRVYLGKLKCRQYRYGPPTASSRKRINPIRIRRLWDPTAGNCYSAPARENKSWSRYRRPKTERSCTEAYPGRDARTRQTKLLIPIRRTRLSYGRGCRHRPDIFLIRHIGRSEYALSRL